MAIKTDERGRGKFKPAPQLCIEEVKDVLLHKIKEEMSLIPEQCLDLDVDRFDYASDKMNIVSLFSGCGGLDLGFELAGLAAVIGDEEAMQAFTNRQDYFRLRKQSAFNIIYSNDNFSEANESYKRNFPNHVVHSEKDIRTVRHFPKSNIVLGGFPCPGFSEAGPRLVDDKRNFLYIHFIRCLLESQPEVFIAENVKGMLTLGHGEVIRQIIEDFGSAGYNVKYKLLDARDYGAPQIRQRVVIVGVRQDVDFDYTYPEPTHGNSSSLKPHITLESAIGDLQDNPGDCFTGSFSSIYLSRNRKKRWDEQSFTIQASGRQAPLHPGGPPMEYIKLNHWILPGDARLHRRLSVKEIARIQTFPDWFEFYDGGNENASVNNRLDKVYKQIGNAVPVMLAKAIAKPIADSALLKKVDSPLKNLLVATSH